MGPQSARVVRIIRRPTFVDLSATKSVRTLDYERLANARWPSPASYSGHRVVCSVELC